jgi:hypothetical protein
MSDSEVRSASPPTSDEEEESLPDGVADTSGSTSHDNDVADSDDKELQNAVQEMTLLLASHQRSLVRSLLNVCTDALWQSTMFLDVKSLARLSITCKYMRQVAGSDQSSSQVQLNDFVTRHRHVSSSCCCCYLWMRNVITLLLPTCLPQCARVCIFCECAEECELV